MSKQGAILRGEKWYNLRDIDGNLPIGVTSDPNKMVDVNLYLETTKEQEPVKETKTKSKKKK